MQVEATNFVGLSSNPPNVCQQPVNCRGSPLGSAWIHLTVMLTEVTDQINRYTKIHVVVYVDFELKNTTFQTYCKSPTLSYLSSFARLVYVRSCN